MSCSYCRNINWNIKDTFDLSLKKKKKKKKRLICYTLSNDNYLWIKLRITKSYNRRTIYILKKKIYIYMYVCMYVCVCVCVCVETLRVEELIFGYFNWKYLKVRISWALRFLTLYICSVTSDNIVIVIEY